MQTKLTLSIDKSVIHHAKLYANKRKKSLSQIIEDYLKSLSNNKGSFSLESIPPVTKSLAGILKGRQIVDHRSAITDYLETKYK
jgi:Family of unknown function (DUF6364)